MNAPPDPALDSAAAPTESRWGSALGSKAAHARLWLTAVLGLIADLWSKHWAFEQLPFGRRDVIEGVLSFQQSYNAGALWGMGRGLAPLFVVASIVALVFVMYVFAHSRRPQIVFHVALGLVLGGALGNLYDRLFEGGRVRDFIKIEWTVLSREVWPWIFNVADILLVVGVVILVLHILFERPQRNAERDEASQPQ